MNLYTVVITQTETRTYTLQAETQGQAIQRAEEANENPLAQRLTASKTTATPLTPTRWWPNEDHAHRHH